MLEGSWAVRYADGSVMAQFDVGHPLFLAAEGHPRGGEVPLRAIEWPRVTELILESEHDRASIPIVDPGPGYRTALKQRTYHVSSKIRGPITYHDADPGGRWVKTQDSLGRDCWFELIDMSLALRAFLVCTIALPDPGPDDPAAVRAATVHTLYWLPDGTTHACHDFNCPDMVEFLQAICRLEHAGLMPSSWKHVSGASAAIA